MPYRGHVYPPSHCSNSLSLSVSRRRAAAARRFRLCDAVPGCRALRAAAVVEKGRVTCPVEGMYTRLFIFRIVTKISGKQKFPNFWEFIRKFGKTEIAKFPEFEFSENLGPKGVSSIRTPDVIGRARETAFCLKLRTLKTNKDLPTLRVSIHCEISSFRTQGVCTRLCR